MQDKPHEIRQEKAPQLRIDRDAAGILNSAARAVSAIIARREQLDRAGFADRPLAVLAGECHTMPAHIIHHMLVLDGLAKRQQHVAAAWESDHNMLSQSFFAAARQEAQPRIAAAIAAKDPSGALGMKQLFLFRTSGASHARKALVHLLSNLEIPSALTDAATAEDDFDASDPSTAHSIRVCLGEALAADPSWITREESVFTRNHHMVEKSLEHARRADARILFQMCGLAHVCGMEAYGYAPSQSLSALFREKDIPVLALPMLTGSADETLPRDHGLGAEELHTVSGLPQIEFGTGPLMEPQLREITCTESYIAKTGLRAAIGTLDERGRQEAEFSDEMRDTFRRWKAEFYPAP